MLVGNPKKEGSKVEATWSSKVDPPAAAVVLAVFPPPIIIGTAWCGRVDPLRRLDPRLVKSKTNLRRAKMRYI